MPEVLSVKDLVTKFYTETETIHAVNGVSFYVDEGETLGVVGESGCGKSVTMHSLLRLIPMPPGRIEAGEAIFQGRDLLRMSPTEIRQVRGAQIGMVFQDPMTSLNPVITIEKQVAEPMLIHRGLTPKAARERVVDLLDHVGIPSPAKRLADYPHQFSGGMRQRVMIAMALITRPELLIADEPTTALDVTVQAQILELIRSMQQQLGMAVIFITHDLAVVAGMCDRVQVMYAGRIVESAATDALFASPRHPYTRALQRSIPALQPKGRELYSIQGLPPDLTKPLPGCPFSERCDYVREKCRTTVPALLECAPGHRHACLRAQEGEI